jgi:hypothetical protein
MTVNIDDAERTICRAENAEHVPAANVDERSRKLPCVSRPVVLAAKNAEERTALSRVELLVATFDEVAFVNLAFRVDSPRAFDRCIDRSSKTERTAHRLQQFSDHERGLTNARDLSVRFENGTREVALVT